MTKFDSSPPPVTLTAASISGLAPVRRLIVLVPAETDYSAAAHRIWELASASQSRVQFLGLCSNVAQEFSLRRQLVTLSAMVQDDNVHAETRLEIGSNWISAIKSDLQVGDMLVCFAEQRAGIFHRPLNQILKSSLSTPVYVLSGLSTQSQPRLNWLSQIVVWLGSIGILAGAAVLQIKITSMPNDWAQTTMLIISVIVEAWLIWGWNGLFS